MKKDCTATKLRVDGKRKKQEMALHSIKSKTIYFAFCFNGEDIVRPSMAADIEKMYRRRCMYGVIWTQIHWYIVNANFLHSINLCTKIESLESVAYDSHGIRPKTSTDLTNQRTFNKTVPYDTHLATWHSHCLFYGNDFRFWVVRIPYAMTFSNAYDAIDTRHGQKNNRWQIYHTQEFHHQNHLPFRRRLRYGPFGIKHTG